MESYVTMCLICEIEAVTQMSRTLDYRVFGQKWGDSQEQGSPGGVLVLALQQRINQINLVRLAVL